MEINTQNNPKNIERLDINLLKPNPTNPRTIKDEKFKKLVQSIKEFPEMLDLRPIILNEELIILGGNMRYRACIEAGIKTVPVIIAKGLSSEQQKEFIIKDNIGFGEWDWSIINAEFDLEKIEIWGLDLPDLSDKLNLSAEEDQYDIPEHDKIKTDIVKGDVFEIGVHRLLCGDSTDVSEWKKIITNEQVDLVVTDPPYNVSYVGKTKDALTIKNDKQSNDSFFNFLFNFYSALGSFTKGGGGMVCVAR